MRARYITSQRENSQTCLNRKIIKLQDYSLMIYELVMLHRDHESAVDMGDGKRSVRSIHLTALTSDWLPATQEERIKANRLINL